ncbi:hypothetical protein NMG29_26145 [Streptomyces cocklensis]|uniref:Uncharacterized protein n=1 Tax=Actinacidiphila cocklensis TaxID=887465 RepID=A0A9W4DLM0_9ACTN|nr:hypothetical protein [Actinacidiphila cocklensis]MDD1061656.1 hypothetical protein [Actinacidiphila cocklensis]CAG6392407.1 conserved membrane hypothetical protein [Actinacidiphila cocklensis]
MSDHGAYEYGDGYGQGRGHDEQAYGGAAPYGTDGTYVPEPLHAAPPSPQGQDAGYGAPPAGDDWAGHAAAHDGQAYGAPAPAAGDGWGATPPAAHPWTAPQEYPQAGWEPAAPQGAFPPGAAAFEAQGAPWQQPQAHAYADPQSYPAEQQAAEHTAVLPVIEDEPAAARPGGRAARRGARTVPVRPDGRTGSPIIAPGIQPAALTAALGLLLAGGAALGKPGLTVFLVLLQAVTAAGWFRLNGMWPARQGIVLAFLAGVTADVAMLAADGDHAPEVVAGTLGVWLLLVLVLQLRHHGSADERLSSLTATSASTLITVLACGYLAAAVSDAGKDAVVAGAVAVAAATLVRALPLPGEPLSVLTSLLAAAVTGAATGGAGGLGSSDGILLAVACGACAMIGLRVASYDFPSRFVHFTAGVALPLTAAAPVVYALGRALT